MHSWWCAYTFTMLYLCSIVNRSVCWFLNSKLCAVHRLQFLFSDQFIFLPREHDTSSPHFIVHISLLSVTAYHLSRCVLLVCHGQWLRHYQGCCIHTPAKTTCRKTCTLTAEHKREKREARKQKQAAIDAEVDQWFSFTMAKAGELAERFNKKPRYFLDIFFQGGARMVHESSTNPWNAFMSKKAGEVNGKWY